MAARPFISVAGSVARRLLIRSLLLLTTVNVGRRCLVMTGALSGHGFVGVKHMTLRLRLRLLLPRTLTVPLVPRLLVHLLVRLWLGVGLWLLLILAIVVGLPVVLML